MDKAKRKKLITVLVKAALCAVLLIIISEPANGRNFTVHLIDTIVLQADPPEGKLMRYMKKKYGMEFERVTDESLLRQMGYDNATNWDYWENGIVVRTESYPGLFFYVQDYYGKIQENFFCYINREPAEEYLEKVLAENHGGECRVVLHPWNGSANPDSSVKTDTPEDYLKNVAFHTYVIVNAEDIDKGRRETINEVLRHHHTGHVYFICGDFDLSDSSLETDKSVYERASKYYLRYYSDGEHWIKYKQRKDGWGMEEVEMEET